MKKILFILPLFLIACSSEPDLTSGTVVNKRFEPAHYETRLQQVYSGQNCSGSGAQRVCTPIYTYVPVNDYYPDDWDIQLKACGEEAGKEKISDCRTSWIDVSEEVYNQYGVGKHYPNPQ
jgi:hypothetical protein